MRTSKSVILTKVAQLNEWHNLHLTVVRENGFYVIDHGDVEAGWAHQRSQPMNAKMTVAYLEGIHSALSGPQMEQPGLAAN